MRVDLTHVAAVILASGKEHGSAAQMLTYMARLQLEDSVARAVRIAMDQAGAQFQVLDNVDALWPPKLRR